MLVSSDSDLCPNTFGGEGGGEGGGGDGANQNAAHAEEDNAAQMLLARSTDGGQTFGAPVKVADYYDLPDCATYQNGRDPGRSCVPEKGATANSFFRAANYPVGAVNPRNPRQVVVTFASYINRHSNESNGCVPQGFSRFGNPLYDGVKTVGACNNDIVVSVSNNAGASFGADDPRELPPLPPPRGRRPPISGSTGPPSPRTRGWPSRTTTASTATTRSPASRTSACPGRATCATSGSGA